MSRLHSLFATLLLPLTSIDTMSKKATSKVAKEGAANGATVKDVPAGEFIVALAAHFKKAAKIEVPDWADIVKTGTFKELGPQDPDWYYVRAGQSQHQTAPAGRSPPAS